MGISADDDVVSDPDQSHEVVAQDAFTGVEHQLHERLLHWVYHGA